MKSALLHLLVLVLAGVFMIPFAWTVSTALKTKQQSFASPPEWIPRTYRIRDDSGKLLTVNVTQRIDQPGAVVTVKSGTRTGQTLGVAQADLSEKNAVHFLKLRNPTPVAVSVDRWMPCGLVQVKVPDASNPDKTVDRYIDPSQLIAVFDPQFVNFKKAWLPLDKGGTLPLPFHRFVLNTYTITIINIIGQTLSCSLVAYGFARFRFRGRKALFLLLLSTMMLPGQVTVIPVYLIWNKAHLVDTFAPLSIPAWFAQSAFFVFLLRQFFLNIPRELDEAAMIDGCGPLRIWWQILMPLSKPAITTVAVLSFIGHWDDFVGPLIYLNDLSNYTVSIALRLFQDQYGSEFSLLMAAALVHIIPVVVLFFLAQRYFVKGIAMTGLKA
jgi:ABC-type glycerol-3-phosphate transport system permease component